MPTTTAAAATTRRAPAGSPSTRFQRRAERDAHLAPARRGTPTYADIRISHPTCRAQIKWQGSRREDGHRGQLADAVVTHQRPTAGLAARVEPQFAGDRSRLSVERV